MANLVSPTMPKSPRIGDVWHHTVSGLTFEYQRTASGGAAWVQMIVPSLVAPAPAVAPIVTNDNPKVTSSPLAPDIASPGDLWYHTETGVFFIRYDDGDTVQWVTTQPTKVGDIVVVTGPAGGDLTGSYPNPFIKPDVELTGHPTLETAPSSSDDSLKLASTSWVNDAIQAITPPSGFAPIDSPVFTGDPKAPTPATADNDTSIATTAFVKNQGYVTSAGAAAAAPVQSVAGKTGAVTLVKGDVGLGNVDNTSDVNKPISTATQTALNLKAPLADPIFTGDPKAPTPITTDNDTSIATTAFVRAAIATFSPPPDLSGYAPLASPTFTGDPKAPTPATADNDTSVATTAFVKNQGYQTIAGMPSALPPNGPAGGDLTGTYPNPTIRPGTNGQVLTTVAGVAAWAAASGGASISIGTTPPASPTAGALWWYSDASTGGGQMYIYYNDGNSSQWVPAANPGTAIAPVTVGGDFYAQRAGSFSLGGSDTVVPFDAVVTGNSGNWYNPSTGRYTPPAGRYHVFASLGSLGTTNTIRNAAIRKNGSYIARALNSDAPTAGNYYIGPYMSAIVDANGTDYFDVVGSTSAGTTSIFANGMYFGAVPVGVVVPMPVVPGTLQLYSEQVLSAAAASLSVTFPANARKVEIEYFIVNNTAVNDVICFRAMLNGVPNTSANYNSQSVIGSVTTPSASQSIGATSWSGGNSNTAKGTLRLGLSATQPFTEHTQYLSSTTQVFSILWGYSGTAGAGMNGMQMFNNGGTQFAAGSYMRAYVVQ